MAPLWLVAALAVVAASYFASGVLIPLATALFLAILLDPLVSWCEARGLRRGRGSFLVVLAFLLGTGVLAWGCSQPFSRLLTDLPRYTAKIRLAAFEFDRRARAFATSTELVHRAMSADGSAAAGAETAESVNSWSQFFWRGLGSFFEAAGIAAFVPFLMIFMLEEKHLLFAGLARLAGPSCDLRLIDRETAQMVRAYFSGNFLAAVGMALLHWLLFFSLGLRNAAGLGLVAGVLTLIPLLGLPAALLLPAAQALLQFERVLPLILLAGGMTALHMLTANYVLPRVIGGRVKINSTAATAGLLFWGWLWGVTGFVLAVPLTALIKVLLESSKDTEAYAGLLAAEVRTPQPWFVRRWLAGSRRAHRPLAPR
ncbi:MAG TPA: AI-2E family transporter [Elusimicrobiota bacterium]|jgi:predicted PurR-regulated permease PerM|nr:AI-2E family transporter [Elusimicrobiota bacterium]